MFQFPSGSRRGRPRLVAGALLLSAALALPVPGTALARGGPDSGGDPAPEPSTLAHNAGDDWQSSDILWQNGFDCVTGYPTKKIGSFVAFKPPRASGITVGDSFLSEISVGVAGSCSGALVRMMLKPPPGVGLDASRSVTCTLWSSGLTGQDVTADPSANCSVAAVQADGTIDLGQRLVPNLDQFEVFVPLRATGSVNGGPLTGWVTSNEVVDQGPLEPSVALTVSTVSTASSLPAYWRDALQIIIWNLESCTQLRTLC